MKKIYIITYIEKEHNNGYIFNVLDVFSTLENAENALNKYKKHEIDTNNKNITFSLYEKDRNFSISTNDRYVEYRLIERKV